MARALLGRPVLLLLLLGSTALAEEAVRRQEVDGGVHVPVLTRPPALESFVQAEYPAEALAQGLTAEVAMQITIGADGTVTDAQVSRPAGHGFDEAALAAVRQFRFTPAEVDGQPAPIQIEYVYHFTLQAKPVEPDAPPPPPPKATLEGRLVARGSRSRIEGATVRCGDDPEAPTAVSDAEGWFTLKVPAGECKVKVLAPDFLPYETTEQLAPDERTEVVYFVSRKPAANETYVRGNREKKEVVRRTLERQELQKVPGSFGDPVRVLQNFPGVARAPFISGALIVRGASPSQTLTFLDGVEIPILFHLGGGPSVVNGEFLDRIDFFPGGFGGRYGRAVGGIVDVATRKGATDTLHGSVKVDLQDSGFYVESPIGKNASVAAAARRSYVDALIPLVLPKDPEGGTLLVLPQYWDYQVRMDLGSTRAEVANKAGGSSSYHVMAFGSDDVLKVVATGGGRNRDVNLDVHTLFHRLKGDWTYRRDKVTFNLTPYVGYDLVSLDFGGTNLKLDQYAFGVREDLQIDLSANVTLRVGADLLLNHITGEAELPVISGTQFVAFPGAEPKARSQRFARTLESFDGALYAEADFKLGPVTLTPGVRASHAFVNRGDRDALDPRLWARWRLGDWTSLKGSLGLYTQPPNPGDMEDPPFGNPGLEHERAFQSAVGIEQKLTDFVNVDLTGYYNRRYENVVSPGRTVVNEDGSITRERVGNAGLGRAYGLELLLRHDVSEKFFGWVAYTWNRSEESREGADRYWITSWDQTHILTVVGSYKLPFNFELGARFRYVTGAPRTPLVHEHDLYQADSNRFGSQSGEFRSARLRDFHQLDLRLDRHFVFDRWTLSAYVDVQNVYNAQNVEATFYDYRFRQSYDVPGIPVLPILGLKGSF